ncbi:MAG: hypothetical protein JW809_03415 [Pirellulales bacterium]|nr:hypothetical protein [Pirellulales bacterium]
MAVVEPVVVEDRPKRGWFGRNWWWVLLLGLVGVVVVCGGLCTGVFFAGLATVKDSPPYQMTLDRVRAEPRVVQRLGEPIEDDFMPTQADVDERPNGGTARLRFGVSGPKGAAEVSSESRMIGDTWGLVRVEVTFEDGERITLDTSAGGAEGLDAPLWKP